MASDAAARFFTAAEVAPFAFHWEIEGDVPRSRGLGSSVTVRLGLLHGLNELAGARLRRSASLSSARSSRAIRTTPRPRPSAASPWRGGAQPARASRSRPSSHSSCSSPTSRSPRPTRARPAAATRSRSAPSRSCANACRITAAFARQNYELLRGASMTASTSPSARRSFRFCRASSPPAKRPARSADSSAAPARRSAASPWNGPRPWRRDARGRRSSRRAHRHHRRQ